jgi:hypothetical protein
MKFVVNQNKQMLMEDREKTLNLLINLGFIVNLEKSNLIPTQTITSMQEAIIPNR